MVPFGTRARLTKLSALAALTLVMTACASPGNAGETPSPTDDNSELGTIRVGALPSPAGDILTFVQDNLARDAHLDIEIVPYTDFDEPNISLDEGATDAILVQSAKFLDTFNQTADSDLVSTGPIYLPIGAFYSNMVENFGQLPDGSSIAVPSDPTNEGRALKILAAASLIATTEEPTSLADITANPHGFSFIEIESENSPRAVLEYDAAFVTLTFALSAGLTPEQAILAEGPDSSYSTVLATTPELEDDPRVEKLKELLLSDTTQQYANSTWPGLVLPAQS